MAFGWLGVSVPALRKHKPAAGFLLLLQAVAVLAVGKVGYLRLAAGGRVEVAERTRLVLRRDKLRLVVVVEHFQLFEERVRKADAAQLVRVVLGEDVQHVLGGDAHARPAVDDAGEGSGILLRHVEPVRHAPPSAGVDLHAVYDGVARAVHALVQGLVAAVGADGLQGHAVGILRVAVNDDKSLAVARPVVSSETQGRRKAVHARNVAPVGILGPARKVRFEEVRRLCVGSAIILFRVALEGEAVGPHHVRHEKLEPPREVFGVLRHVPRAGADGRERRADLRVGEAGVPCPVADEPRHLRGGEGTH